MDDRGVPGVLVATTEFREAAEYQNRSLGFEPAVVWIPHPIQDRTAAELEVLAQDSVAAILAALKTEHG